MRLLIDSVAVGSGGALQLRDELAPSVARLAPTGSDVVLLTASPIPITAPNLTAVTIARPRLGWLGRWWWHNWRLPRLARKHAADVVYFMSGIVSRRVAPSAASVTNFNNMVPFSSDPSARSPVFSRARLRNILLRRLYVSGLRRADAVVLHSRHAVDMVTPYAGDISAKTFVVLTGVPRDIDWRAAAAAPHPYDGRSYLLYLSTFYPYKNHLRLIDAYARCAAANADLPDLLLAGIPSDPRYFRRVSDAIAKHRLGSRIRYVGILGRDQIPVWVHHATVNFFASTIETNPVTIAEILALRGVLACSGVPPMPEIAGEGAAYFDPYSVDSISAVMSNLTRDVAARATLQERGARRATELSWDECARKIWKAAEAGHAAYLRRIRR